MKRILPFLLILTVLSACTSTQTGQRVTEEEASTALLEVLRLSAHTVETNLYDQYTLLMLLPPEVQHFPPFSEIPRFLELLYTWETQVKQAFRAVMLEMPTLIETASSNIVFTDSLTLITSSNSSASETLAAQQGEGLQEHVRTLLQTNLLPSEATWALINDRYNLWAKANGLWGTANLSQVEADPLRYLEQAFITTYQKQLSAAEATLRTTPVPRGAGSSLEIFQQGKQ